MFFWGFGFFFRIGCMFGCLCFVCFGLLKLGCFWFVFFLFGLFVVLAGFSGGCFFVCGCLLVSCFWLFRVWLFVGVFVCFWFFFFCGVVGFVLCLFLFFVVGFICLGFFWC